MNEEKSLHDVKGLPMPLVNFTQKKKTTTMSKTNLNEKSEKMEMKAALTCTSATPIK